VDHEWHFLALAVGTTQHVINVCGACGEARSTEVSPYGGSEHRVDLSGDCEGRPRRPGAYEVRRPG